MAARKALNFEKALAELEQLVEEMEQGELSLEDTLKRFEKGIALTTECQQALQNAELKVTQLVENLAAVVDRAGCTLGIITLEDLIEKVTGAIADEFDPPEETP